MERLYNPALMSDEELRATFVARQPLIDDLLSLIEHQPDGAGVQHVVLIGPRGMGKTTTLLRLRLAITERGLDAHWQPVRFPEESYGVTDLAGLWLETLKLLAAETNDPSLEEQTARLPAQYADEEDLHEAAFAVLKDWRRQHQKRLVLLVDNFDLMLEQINDEQENARLRNVLMNDGTLMLVGGATTFFHEARAYDQPLYNFFKIYNLAELQFTEIQDLLRQRARRDQIPDLEQKLTGNPGRLRALIYFTGGNPRLVLMLYQVVIQADFVQVRTGLDKLIEEVTPYYKAKTESLAVQQRKVLDHIARESAITHEGVTPSAIAAAIRLPVNQVSTLLKRLAELGYVRAANLRERSSYYTLSEPLYAIWYQMRFGRDARQRMQWLVSFLQVWYQDTDISTTSKQLESRFREYGAAGHLHEARGVLEHRRYLAEITKDNSLQASERDRVVRGYLDLKDLDTVKKEVLPGLKLEQLLPGTLLALRESECISEQATEQALSAISESPTDPPDVRAWAEITLGIEVATRGRMEEALQHFDRAIAIKPDKHEAWYNRGNALLSLGRYEKALVSYDRALAIKLDKDEAWNNRGVALLSLGQYAEALASYDRAVAIKPDNNETWYNRGLVLGRLGRPEEALASFDRAIALDPDNNEAWYYRGVACLLKSKVCLQEGNRELATLNWREAWKSAEHVEKEKWYEVASIALLDFVRMGQPEFARQLLAEAQLDEALFPLARALDYLLTGDEALLEKLSPEVKKLVEEMVEKLRAVGKHSKRTGTQQRAKKPRSGPRRRMAKQLR